MLRVARKQLGSDSDAGLAAENLGGTRAGPKRGMGPAADTPLEKPVRFKTYRDNEEGFEINVPEDWSLHRDTPSALPPILRRWASGWNTDTAVAFTRGASEILNVVVETMTPEPTPELTEASFRFYAASMNLADCEYGRIIVGNKAHTWARYQMRNGIWSKKHMPGSLPRLPGWPMCLGQVPWYTADGILCSLRGKGPLRGILSALSEGDPFEPAACYVAQDAAARRRRDGAKVVSGL
jgi:hypothetical protein